jgi:mannosyltransferase OCH1-like enzyme
MAERSLICDARNHWKERMAPQTIPRLVHQLWIDPSGSNRNLPQDVHFNVRRWQELHPAFMCMVWSLPDLEPMLKNVAGLNIWSSMRHLRFPAMQADVVRLALIFQYGGFWSDLKNCPLRPFLGYLIDKPSAIFVEHWPTSSQPSPAGYICNAFFGAERQNSFIFACLKQAHENIRPRPRMLVFEMTGGGLIQRIRRRCGTDCRKGVRVLSHRDVWNVLMKRTAASYNVGNRHWSFRQKREPLYMD